MPDHDFAAVEAKLQTKQAEAAGPQQILLTVIQAVGAGRFDQLPQYFTEDTELQIHGFPPMKGAWRGAKEVASAMAANFNIVTDQTPTLEAMIHQGDVVAVRIRERGKLKSGNIAYEVNGVLWFTFAEGRISRIEEFLDAVFR